MIDNKVTLFVSSLSGGGAEGVCVNLANGLSDRGYDVTLLVLNLENAQLKHKVIESVNVVSLGVDRARNVFFKLRQYLAENNVKFLLVFNYELTVISVLVRATLKGHCKIIARNINTISQNTKSRDFSWWKKKMIAWFYCKADHVVNQCKAMQEDLIMHIPALEGKTSVIYNPVNKQIEDFAENTDFSSISKDNYILCVGRLEEQKAFHRAIDAFSLVIKKYPDLRLKIVGEGSLEPQLKQLATELKVSDSVDFEGFQSDIIPYYLKARMTLLTSLYEGFPNALIESITLGTPVVSVDCSSGPSEIIHIENGFLVSSKDSLTEFIQESLNYSWNYSSVSSSSLMYRNSQNLDSWISIIESHK
ncbi:glycosyltransferase [Parashewanella curva]|uniref:Glycosyltransferase n=1 Tax=Parashewanella curva TaxID=2338552 RepID=A0A3L8Q1R1_9GAMM|nr:glycosyltransferase [Parashewanella curva]RLV61410.1 glycosyltransferase [Parashewanella curva]